MAHPRWEETMQIPTLTSDLIARTYTRQVHAPADGAARAAPRSGEGRPRTDSVTFSEIRQEVQRLREAAAAATDERADRVAMIKAQLAAGTYEVDNYLLAAKLLG
jgi:negative regulator of flagellin synthesis FlgM